MGRETAKKIISYLDKLIKHDSRESSKRAIAIFVTTLIGVIVIAYTDKSNMLLVLAELIAFVSALVYVSSREKGTKLKDDEDSNN